MAKFLKHVGKHGDRKVAVIFRQIPGEDHMALVVYTETLNQNIHDPLIAAIESDAGQSSENLADALNRSYTKDGQIILQMIHREGMMKKVQTGQIVMTPTPGQTIRLDELNNILNEMAKGEEAVKKLAEIDASRGLQDPKDVARRMRDQKAQATPATPNILGNNDIATNLRQQAVKMASEAKGLLAEADRLLREASNLDPAPAPAKERRAKKEVVVQVPAMQEPKKAGRPKKTVAMD
jgi:predicted O-linked N-acetylglucosamine transferase (SPINDLY family)